MKTIKVGVLAATGAVGQKFIRLLDGHPQLRLSEVYASERSQGKTYEEAVHWLEETPIPKQAAGLEVKGDGAALDADILFSALPGGMAGPLERAYAAQGHAVFTNARDLRLEPDVPLVIADVNGDHLALVEHQRRLQKSEGFVVANGNCTTITMALTLKPVLDAFGIQSATMVSLQALSGAGYPGVSSMDILSNVVPFIRNEEERVRLETPRFLGRLGKDRVEPEAFPISATCTRVPVLEGHTEVITVTTKKKATAPDVAEAMLKYTSEPQRLKLPSAPRPPIVVRTEDDRPQPRKDAMTSGGMAAVVGRFQDDAVSGGVRYVALSSNTIRGAAGASILNAELAVAKKLI
jgi:aspartate-semialdehyde dehydrogenase